MKVFLAVAEGVAEADHTLVVFWGHGGPTRTAGLSHEVIVELCKDLDILAYDACMVWTD